MAACGQGGAGRQRAGGAFQEAGNASYLLGERVGDMGGCIRQKSSSCTPSKWTGCIVGKRSSVKLIHKEKHVQICV